MKLKIKKKKNQRRYTVRQKRGLEKWKRTIFFLKFENAKTKSKIKHRQERKLFFSEIKFF